MSARSSRLPLQPGRLIGRDDDLTVVRMRLFEPDMRLLTLVGPPGVGKTRLALAVAAQLASSFTQGIVFVELASVTDPAIVPSVIGRHLGVQEQTGAITVEQVATSIGDGDLLLLLDNFEHLLAAAPVVSTLLAMCAGLRVLVTSRAPLDLRWEHRVLVAPLGQAAARELFIERARAAAPHLSPEGMNEHHVTGVVDRLDRLPLAIEMAAARAAFIPLPVLAEQLEEGIGALAVRTRDLPARQRTLRDTIAWSYDLLSSEQQALFRRLAIFEGGWTPAAAAEVAGETARDTLADLAALVEMHLVALDMGATDEPRFTMLQTIAEFAREELATSGEEEALRERHAEYLVAWADVAERKLESAQERRWFRRLEQELPNVRAALGWLRGRGMIADGLALASALGPFWLNAGHITEGRRWLVELLPLAESRGVDARTRSAALTWSAVLTAEQGEVGEQRAGADTVIRRLEEALALSLERDDARGILRALGWLVHVLMLHEDTERAVALADEGIERCRAAGDRWWLASFLYRATLLAQSRGEHDRAMTLARECVAVAREAGHGRMAARGVQALAQIRLFAQPDRLDLVHAELEESLTLAEAAGDTRQVATTLGDLGSIAVERGDLPLGAHWHHRSLLLAREIGSWQAMALAVMGTAEVACERGDGVQFARLHGALLSSLDVLRRGIPVEYWNTYQRRTATMRSALGEAAFAEATEAGGRLSWDDVVAEALAYADRVAAAPEPPPTGPAVPEPRYPDGLTPREVEVLRLLVAGQTNREIAEVLVLSIRTVERHIETIYSKIGVRGKAARAAAAAYALQHDLT